MNSTGNSADGAVVNGPSVSAVGAHNDSVSVNPALVDDMDAAVPDSDELFPENARS